MIHEGRPALDTMTSLWEPLISPGLRLGPFPAPRWCQLWWDGLGHAEGDVVVISAGAGEAVTGVAAMVREDHALVCMGGRELTDYTVPCATASTGLPNWQPIADAILDAAQELRVGVECPSVPIDTGFATALAGSAADRGRPTFAEATEPAPVLPLPADLDAYFAALDAKERHELRRKIRRFTRDVGEPALRRATPVTLDSDLDLFFSLHRRAPGDKGAFMTSEREKFFRSVATAYVSTGALALDVLCGGGEPVAVSFSFVVDDTIYLYNSALDPRAIASSPGMVLIERLIDRSIADGLGRFDFLKGSERYKFQLGGVARPLSRVTIGAA